MSAEYQEAMEWAKAKTKQTQQQANAKIEELKQRAEEARKQGRNNTAAYLQQIADKLRAETNKK